MMKKVLSAIGSVIFGIIAAFFIIITLVGMILCTPIDFIRYHLSPYYKGTKEKYTWQFTFFNPYYMLYNLIKRKNLPIEFYHDTNSEYRHDGFFIYNNALILPDCGFVYDDEEEKWIFNEYVEDEDADANNCTEIDIYIDKEMKRCNEFCGENTCNYVYALVVYNEIPENAPTEFEHFRFIPVKNDDYKSALEAIINYIA